MPRSPSPLEYFLDRSLGRRTLAEALRATGRVIRTMDEVYGTRVDVPDGEWLERAGKEGWIVLTKDTRMRHRPVELEAIVENGVRVFVLTSGSLSARAQLDRLLPNMNRVDQAARKPGPFVYGIYERRIERIWPRSS